ncbi:MAG: acetyl-CoA hydrolase/transferase C-terminal domain-containing protein [Chloroflexota bacterium]|nr:acetyl-CoA hydrolase/transferase C-terminal domain-containing protein [Chloroflexota bacterium]
MAHSSMNTMSFKKEWRTDFDRKLVTAEEAVKVIKSGDLVVTPLPTQPTILQEALAARASELRNVTISSAATAIDPGWFSPGMEQSFNVAVELFIGSRIRPSVDERRATYLPNLFSLRHKGIDEGRPESAKKQIDVFLVSVSPPDERGFCSFGHTLWHKRAYAKRAKTVIAEIEPMNVRTFGANNIHVSEIDYFVQLPEEPPITDEEWQELYAMFYKNTVEEVQAKLRISPPRLLRILIGIGRAMGSTTAGDFVAPHLGLDQPTESAKGISHYLRDLVDDGDTFQVGVGRPSSFMVKLGTFDNKIDLGLHTEMGCPGLPLLVRDGVVTGKYKTLHPGKAVFSSFMGCDADDIDFVSDNPLFEQYDSDYVVNIKTVAANDNMVAINNGLQVDLTGQICSETQFGPRMINGQGGQTETHIGAMLSRGGRAITLLPATSLGGMSTIVPQLDKGSLVTIPRQLADIVVTEYGVARLLDKTHRERAEELIAIAHPDHRTELREEAKKLFWP